MRYMICKYGDTTCPEKGRLCHKEVHLYTTECTIGCELIKVTNSTCRDATNEEKMIARLEGKNFRR